MLPGLGFWGRGGAPWAFVRSAVGLASGSAATVALPGPVAAGNALFVATSGYNENIDPVPTGITSTPPNAWTKAADSARADLPQFNGRGQTSIWYALDAAPGTTAVTVAFAGAPAARVAVAEFSGVAAAAALDRTAAAGAYSESPQTLTVGPTGATGAPNQLVLAIAGAATGSAGFGNVDFATPAGFVRLASQGDGFNATAFEVCYKVAAAAGPQTAAFGAVPMGNAATAVIAAFRGAA